MSRCTPITLMRLSSARLLDGRGRLLVRQRCISQTLFELISIRTRQIVCNALIGFFERCRRGAGSVLFSLLAGGGGVAPASKVVCGARGSSKQQDQNNPARGAATPARRLRDRK